MGLFDYIEKLITEHGSAAILREQVTLLRMQFEALERKNRDLATALQESDAEAVALQRRIADLQSKIDNLTQEKSGLNADAEDLPKIRQTILHTLAHGNLNTDEIVEKLGIGREAFKFHAETMIEAKLISSAHMFGMGPDLWGLEQMGRRYLIERGLLE